MGRPRQPQICCSSKCRREIGPTEKGLGITLFGQTLGMGKQRTSKSQRIYVCPQCAVRIAGDIVPPKSAPVDLAFFLVLLDLSGSEQMDVVTAAAELLQERRQELIYPLALPEAEIILPPQRALKAAV